jgi:cob(I)alamin adenosyltransferase
LLSHFTIAQFGAGFVSNPPNKADLLSAKIGMRYAGEAMESGRYDVVILDEINVAVHFGLIKEEDVVEMVKNKPECMELVLTGRYASPKIIEVADYVTEMRKIKHPFPDVHARKGIEY